MKTCMGMIVSAVLVQGLSAQGPDARGSRPAAPARQLATAASLEEQQDYIVSGRGGLRAWSLRDNTWVRFKEYLNPILTLERYYAIRGPRNIGMWATQEYQLVFASRYSGSFKYLWRRERTDTHPWKVGVIPFDDELKIVWELRTSPGVQVVSSPAAPAEEIHYGEPVVSTFSIRVTDSRQQCIDIYICGYRGGRLVTFALVPMTINAGGYSEEGIKSEQEGIERARATCDSEVTSRKCLWTEDMLRRQRSEYEQIRQRVMRYRSDGLDLNEFLTESPVLAEGVL